MREPLIDQITSVVWYDARKEKPKRCGPFLCVDTKGKSLRKSISRKQNSRDGKRIATRFCSGERFKFLLCQARRIAVIGN